VIYCRHGRKRSRAMTIFADVGRLHVGRTFASRFGAIVTAETICRDVCVIEIHRQPSRGTVAVIAIGATRNMCWVLPGRNDAIMAGPTGTDDLSVVNRHDRRP